MKLYCSKHMMHSHNIIHGDCFSTCFFVQSLLSRADAKVKELRHSIDLLKAESEKLEVNSLSLTHTQSHSLLQNLLLVCALCK